MIQENEKFCRKKTEKQNRSRRKYQCMLFSFAVVLFFCCLKFGGIQTMADEETKVLQENEQFEIQLSYGIDGYATYDRPLPVTITIKSDADFTGSVVLQMLSETGQEGNRTKYAQDISLAAGTENEIQLTLYSFGSNYLNLQIRDEKGKTIYEEKDTLNLVMVGNTVPIGVLCDDYSGMTYFDGVMVRIGTFNGVTNTLALNEKNMPADAETLSILNYIIIDNYDTAKLSEKQYSALRTWVENGGILICGLGANYQNVLHIFQDDFVTGTFQGLTKRTIDFHAPYLTDGDLSGTTSDTNGALSEPSSDTNGDVPETSLDTDGDISQIPSQADAELSGSVKQVDVLSFEMQDGEALTTLSDDDIAYQKTIGDGAVILVGCSFSMAPLTEYENRAAFAACVLEASAVEGTERIVSYGGSGYNPYAAYDTSVTEMLDVADKPELLHYGILFGIYILLVGPILYFILDKLKKKQYIWIGIPVLSLLFTGMVFLVGNQTMMRQPVASSFSIIRVYGDTVLENIQTEIVCPKAKEYSFHIVEDCYGVKDSEDSYQDYFYYYDDYQKNTQNEIRKTANGTSLTVGSGDIFRTRMVSMKRTSENTIGHIDTDIKLYTDGFEGTVTNNTAFDFSQLVVVMDGHMFMMNNVKKGETVSIPKNALSDIKGDGFYGSSYYWNMAYSDNEEERQEYNRNTYIYEKMNLEAGSGRGCVWGITDYIEDVMDSDSVSQYGGSAIVEEFYASYEDVTGAYCPDIQYWSVASDGDYDPSDGYIYSDQVIISYQFPAKVRYLRNRSNLSDASGNNYDYGEYANVEALNIETGLYEPIFTDSDTISGETLDKYIYMNSLTLRFTGNGNIMPVISAEGEE